MSVFSTNYINYLLFSYDCELVNLKSSEAPTVSSHGIPRLLNKNCAQVIRVKGENGKIVNGKNRNKAD